jgi:hypothetical protein
VAYYFTPGESGTQSQARTLLRWRNGRETRVERIAARAPCAVNGTRRGLSYLTDGKTLKTRASGVLEHDPFSGGFS